MFWSLNELFTRLILDKTSNKTKEETKSEGNTEVEGKENHSTAGENDSKENGDEVDIVYDSFNLKVVYVKVSQITQSMLEIWL